MSGTPPHMTTLVGVALRGWSGHIRDLSNLGVSSLFFLSFFLSFFAFFATRPGRISWPIGMIYTSKRVFPAKSEHEETFHRRKVMAASSNVQSTVTSSDGKLSVPDVKGIARKPRQQRRSKRSKVQWCGSHRDKIVVLYCNAVSYIQFRWTILNKQQIRIRFRSQSVLAVTYAVTLTFDPLTLNHVLAITCWNYVLNFSEIDQCTPKL